MYVHIYVQYAYSMRCSLYVRTYICTVRIQYEVFTICMYVRINYTVHVHVW